MKLGLIYENIPDNGLYLLFKTFTLIKRKPKTFSYIVEFDL